MYNYCHITLMLFFKIQFDIFLIKIKQIIGFDILSNLNEMNKT